MESDCRVQFIPCKGFLVFNGQYYAAIPSIAGDRSQAGCEDNSLRRPTLLAGRKTPRRRRNKPKRSAFFDDKSGTANNKPPTRHRQKPLIPNGTSANAASGQGGQCDNSAVGWGSDDALAAATSPRILDYSGKGKTGTNNGDEYSGIFDCSEDWANG